MYTDGKNIVLIGMPGSGKSTLGVLLAKTLGLDFVDADILIQHREGKLLQEIIDERGIDEFLKIEEDVLAGIQLKNSVISTGGSAVYSERAMVSLGHGGIFVYLNVPYDEIERRISNISTRGIVIKDGFTLRDTYNERMPLYMKYGNITIDCAGKDIETCTAQIAARLHTSVADAPSE